MRHGDSQQHPAPCAPRRVSTPWHMAAGCLLCVPGLPAPLQQLRSATWFDMAGTKKSHIVNCLPAILSCTSYIVRNWSFFWHRKVKAVSEVFLSESLHGLLDRHNPLDTVTYGWCGTCSAPWRLLCLLVLHTAIPSFILHFSRSGDLLQGLLSALQQAFLEQKCCCLPSARWLQQLRWMVLWSSALGLLHQGCRRLQCLCAVQTGTLLAAAGRGEDAVLQWSQVLWYPIELWEICCKLLAHLGYLYCVSTVVTEIHNTVRNWAHCLYPSPEVHGKLFWISLTLLIFLLQAVSFGIFSVKLTGKKKKSSWRKELEITPPLVS